MGGHEPDGRADAHHAAERGGDPQRPAEIRSLAQRDHARRQRGAAAAGRAAGALRRVPGVARPAEDLVEGVAAGRELGRVGLAEDHRAGGLEPLHDEGVFLRDVILVEWRAERRAEPRDRGDVLDPHGQPAQEAGGLAACQPPLQVAGVVQRSRVERDDRVDRWVVALEPLQTRLDDLDGGDLALGDERPQLDGREISELAAW